MIGAAACGEAFEGTFAPMTRAPFGLDCQRRQAVAAWMEHGPLPGSLHGASPLCRALLGAALAWPTPPAPSFRLALDQLRNTIHSGQTRALGQALAGCLARPDADSLPAWFADAFGALRHPFLSGSPLEGACKAALGVGEDGTLWDAVERFQAVYPGGRHERALAGAAGAAPRSGLR